MEATGDYQDKSLLKMLFQTSLIIYYYLVLEFSFEYTINFFLWKGLLENPKRHPTFSFPA